MRARVHLVLVAVSLMAIAAPLVGQPPIPAPRVIELTADKDSRYRQNGKVSPTITVVTGEPLILRITAVRASQIARDGSIHGLALLDKDSNAVPGWRFFFHPGTQEVAVTAPAQPGRYAAVCLVICSDAHEGMGFTLIVTAPALMERNNP